jgi:alcohol dehydrogenase
VGLIEAVGRDVRHHRPGQRVVLSPHFVENVEDPAQILIGLTAVGAGTTAMQADWRDGTLAEFALAPAATVTPAEGPDAVAAAQLAVLNRAIVQYSGLRAAGSRPARPSSSTAPPAPTEPQPCCSASR